MRVSLAQIDTTVGAVRSNADLILERYRDARSLGAELVVFPELALSGYPPRDLLDGRDFLSACERELLRLAAATRDGGAILVGTPTGRGSLPGKGAWNSAALLSGGGELGRVHKVLLPTYDVFDERRHFEPGPIDAVRPLQLGGLRLGVTICEDVWNDEDFWSHRLYEFDPAHRLVEQGCDLHVNLSASPFHLGKQHLRHRMLLTLARSARAPVLHCNAVGGNDELIFDGASFVATAQGLTHRARAFEEDLLTIDTVGLPTATGHPPLPEPAPEPAAYAALVRGIRDYFRKCGFREAVLGLSGGIDSALVATLAADALGPERVTGITMPSRYSSVGSVADSRRLAALLGIRFLDVAIDPVHAAWDALLAPVWSGAGLGASPADLTDQNLQARIRGTLLMAWSNRTGALLLSTGNKSELATGYCTLYGDMAGGLAVISDLPKTFVWRLSRWINREGERIPWAIIEKPPSAELAPGQLDTDSLPPYPVLDSVLEGYLERAMGAAEIIEATGIDPGTVERVIRLVDRNEYKRRQAAPGLRVTPKAFGLGRRMPVAARLQHHPWG